MYRLPFLVRRHGGAARCGLTTEPLLTSQDRTAFDITNSLMLARDGLMGLVHPFEGLLR